MKRDKNNLNEGHYRALLKKQISTWSHRPQPCKNNMFISSFFVWGNSDALSIIWHFVNKGYHLQHQPDATTRHSSEGASSSSEYFINLPWCPPRCPIKGAKDSICLRTWCIIRPRFIIASLSQCHRFASPPKFIISRWHWQETVFLHNILWSIAHMCIQSHDCYQHWQSVSLSTILEPITCCCYKLLSRLQQFRQIFRVS